MSATETPDEPQPPDSYAEFLLLRNLDNGCPKSDPRREG